MKQSLKFTLVILLVSLLIFCGVLLAIYNNTSADIPFTEDEVQFIYIVKITMLVSVVLSILLSLSYMHKDKLDKEGFLYISHCQKYSIKSMATDDLVILYDRINGYLRDHNLDLYMYYQLVPLKSREYFVLEHVQYKDEVIEFYLQ